MTSSVRVHFTLMNQSYLTVVTRTERDTNLTQLAHCLYDLCIKKFKGPLKKSSLGFYLIQS